MVMRATSAKYSGPFAGYNPSLIHRYKGVFKHFAQNYEVSLGKHIAVGCKYNGAPTEIRPKKIDYRIYNM